MLIKPIKIATCIALVGMLALAGSALGQKQGLQAIDSMKKNLATAQRDSNRAKTIYRITDAYIAINPDSAMQYAQVGLALSKQLNFKKGIAGFHSAIGAIYSDNGSYTKALSFYQIALKINEEIGNKYNTAATLNNMGSTYQRLGDFYKSQAYNFKALKIAEAINASRLIAVLSNNIAKIYATENDYARAMPYHFKALKYYQKIDFKEGIAQVYNSIGNEYHEQKELKVAGEYYEKALAIFKQIDNLIGQATVLSQMGRLHDDDPDLKLSYLLQAKQIFDDTDPQFLLAVTNLGNIGNTYANIILGGVKLKPGKIYKYIPSTSKELEQKAVEYLTLAVKYSRDADDKSNLAEFSQTLAQLQQKTGDYKSALENLQLSQKLADSLYSQESKNKIAELTAQYAFQKKEDGYKQQQQIHKLQMRQLYLYGALAIVLVSGILIFLLNRSRISALRLKNELQRKEAEEQTRELLHQNKLSESELKAIRSQMNPHFIFNVLNSIESYIMENDARMACRLVQKFAALSRLILENSTQSLVVAEREWKALQLYTELEAIRFNNHFKYTFTADKNIDLSTLLLPPMLVQPLIENSIHHGLRNSAVENPAVNINLEQTERELLFTVEDNGTGISESKPKTSAVKSKSIGLSAIRERIEIINNMNGDDAAQFEIADRPADEGTGTIAKLRLPKIFRSI